MLRFAVPAGSAPAPAVAAHDDPAAVVSVLVVFEDHSLSPLLAAAVVLSPLLAAAVASRFCHYSIICPCFRTQLVAAYSIELFAKAATCRSLLSLIKTGAATSK